LLRTIGGREHEGVTGVTTMTVCFQKSYKLDRTSPLIFIEHKGRAFRRPDRHSEIPLTRDI
jgi:hypothetical protein